MGMPPICPYCGFFSEPATGKDIYPHRSDLWSKKFFLCRPCDAYVGTHVHTGKPLGTLANSNLRRLRSAAHAVFDPIWKGGDKQLRTATYSTLAKKMNIPFVECHIGMFNEAQCRQVVDLVNSKEIYRETKKGNTDQAGDP